ncbi:beta-lactamase-like protein [Aspergillus pseudoustus]|uniref:Beta-lactamase-like protein n=1 Tax=Aspergillus pseudoustus TaxID=1810923 RepID=A0ABR4ICB3_9EURO
MDRLSLPNGSTAVDVGIIDSTARLTVPAAHLLAPTTGLDNLTLTAPSYSFLIQHPTGRKVLFDLGLRKDWWNLTPSTAHFLRTSGWKLEAAKNVSEILQGNGESLSAVEAVIWSHHHFDHVGDITTFPATTHIIVGPGFTDHYTPGYPTNPASTLLEAEWQDRTLHELSFQNAPPLKIGSFDAIDFFGDGSFFLLDAPGHTFGHVAALARVAADEQDAASNSFVFMGGDTCHFSAQLRPSVSRPLPVDYTSGAQDSASASASVPSVPACPGAIMDRLLANPAQPLFEMPAANTVDVTEAHASIGKMQAFDAADNVWVVIAHDQSLLDLVEFYPATVNDWQVKKYAERTRWRFWNTLKRRTSDPKLA